MGHARDSAGRRRVLKTRTRGLRTPSGNTNLINSLIHNSRFSEELGIIFDRTGNFRPEPGMSFPCYGNSETLPKTPSVCRGRVSDMECIRPREWPGLTPESEPPGGA
jgi:hypothetical protein